MLISDEENVLLVKSTDFVDATNKKFYERFQYPWIPQAFDCPIEPYFETVMLNQSLGSWDQSIIPRNPRIWIAGCGTNQAIFTALRFPQAEILGSDLSVKSLETTAAVAEQLGISNLRLKEESINKATYNEEFDYVICTGVIHHNAEPKEPLQRLAAALKQTGVLEIMVYNRYHRIMTTAFQKAMRILGSSEKLDFDFDLATAQKLMSGWKTRNLMAQFLESLLKVPEPALADTLLQPVEYSYTIESFESLVAEL